MTESVTEGGAASYESSYTPPDTEKFDIFAEEPPSSGGDLLMPPDPGEDADVAPSPAAKKGAKKTGAVSKPKAVAAKKPLPMGLIATVLGVLIVAGGGWFAWQKFHPAPVETAATDTTIRQAQSLASMLGSVRLSVLNHLVDFSVR